MDKEASYRVPDELLVRFPKSVQLFHHCRPIRLRFLRPCRQKDA